METYFFIYPSLIKLEVLRVGRRKIEELGALRRLTGASWWQKLIKITDQWQDGIFFDNSHKFKQKHVQKNGMKSSDSGGILWLELSWYVHGLAPQFNFDVDYFRFRRFRNKLDICHVRINDLTVFRVWKWLVDIWQWRFIPEVFYGILFNVRILIC